MFKISRFIFFSFLICLCPVLNFAQQNKSFRWSLGLQNVRTADLVSFSAPVRSTTGERFRVVINPEKDCYCYIIAETPGGSDVGVFHAGHLKGGNVWYSPAMELTPPSGSESLFIVVSLSEQKNITQRISALNNNPASTQRRALINEIFRVRSDVSKFKEAPEIPVLMGGATRGDPEKSQGVEFSGLETYVKTISIEH